MTRNAAAKALAKGAQWTLQLLTDAYAIQAIHMKQVGDLYIGFPVPNLLRCHTQGDELQAPTLIESGEEVRYDVLNSSPEAGSVAMCAYHDGWQYEVGLIHFREGEKGLEGYLIATDRWVPASRFRPIWVVIHHGIKDEGGEMFVSSKKGLDFTKNVLMRKEARQSGWSRRILNGALGETVPFYMLRAALGARYLPDTPRIVGHFGAAVDARLIPGAGERTKQYPFLYFEEEMTVTPRAGLLALVAFEREGVADVAAAGLVERNGELWAIPPLITSPEEGEDHALPPSAYRFIRACTGGENPEGVMF